MTDASHIYCQVQSVVKRTPHLQKISFVGHSLGGLVCRYAIAKLYEQRSARITRGQGMECSLNGSTDACAEEVSKKIAGLEPVNFITFATPHLGCRGHKQVIRGFFSIPINLLPLLNFDIIESSSHSIV